VSDGDNYGHEERHLIVCSSVVSSDCSNACGDGGEKYERKVVFAESFEEKGTDYYVKDVEGVGEEEDHGSIGVIVLLGFWKDGKEGGDHHEHGH